LLQEAALRLLPTQEIAKKLNLSQSMHVTSETSHTIVGQQVKCQRSTSR